MGMDIDQAMEKAAEQLESASTTEAPEVAETTATAAPETPEATSTPAPATEKPTTTGQPRRPDGKFAKADKTTATAKPPEATPAATSPAPTPEVTPAVPEAPKFKAPQSWKPLARERWASLPPEVQEEITRRESEVPRVLQEAADARRFQAQVSETLRPYETVARANGMDTMAYANSMLQAGAALQLGTAPQAVGVIANAIKQYGVGRFGPQFVEQLAAALDGQAPQAVPQQAVADPRAIFREELQHAMQQANERRAQSEIERFVRDHEFATDPVVKRRMAALIQADAEAGVETSLNDAYDQVIHSHPEYRVVMERRKATQAATEANASAQRAMAAGVSIRSQSAAPVRAQPRGIDAALAAAADKLGM